METAALNVSATAPPNLQRPPSSRRRLLGGILIREGLITKTQLADALRIQEQLQTHQLLGQILVDQGAITQTQLDAILQKYHKEYRLGDLLVETRAITEDELRIALDHQKKTDLRLGEVLLQLNFLTEGRLKLALSKQLNVGFVDLDDCFIDPHLSSLINESYAWRHRVIPVAKVDNRITVCLDDPTDLEVAEELRVSTGGKIELVTSTRDAFDRAFARVYGQGRDRGLEHEPQEAHEPLRSQDEEPPQVPAPLPGAETVSEEQEPGARARGVLDAIFQKEGDSAMVVAKVGDLRSVVDTVRRILSDCDAVVGSVEALARENEEQRARFDQLQREHQALRESHERLLRELDARVQTLTKMQAEREALMREQEASARALADLQERYEALSQARQSAATQLAVALRHLND